MADRLQEDAGLVEACAAVVVDDDEGARRTVRDVFAVVEERVVGPMRAEVNRLHALVAEARNYIDPEKHAELEAGAAKVAVACDEKIEALTTRAEGVERELRDLRYGLGLPLDADIRAAVVAEKNRMRADFCSSFDAVVTECDRLSRAVEEAREHLEHSARCHTGMYFEPRTDLRNAHAKAWLAAHPKREGGSDE